MTKGLSLARIFYQAGHRVIGADNVFISAGRLSRSLAAYHELSPPTLGPYAYVDSLVEVVLKEKVDLWVSCSGVASAVEDAEAREIIESKVSQRGMF
jgi:hypothetical protein